MGKIAVWILVAVAVLLLFRLFGQGPGRRRRPADPAAGGGRAAAGSDDAGRAAGKDGAGPAAGNELIMACSVCGVHVPASEALFARGKVFCSEAHRDGPAA